MLCFPILHSGLVFARISQNFTGHVAHLLRTNVTYFIWYPNMVELGAISGQVSLTSRESPVRCVRSDMLGDFDSWNMYCNTISITVGMRSINRIYLSNLRDYFWELIWKPHAFLFIHKHLTVANITMRPRCCQLDAARSTPRTSRFQTGQINDKTYINKSTREGCVDRHPTMRC